MMNWGEKLENSKKNPRNQKSLDLDQDLPRNQRVNLIEIFEREEREIRNKI